MAENLAVSILLTQLKDMHKFLEGTMEGVTDEVADFVPPGQAPRIAGLYAHLLMSEDFFIHGLLQSGAPLMATSWKDKTGASELQPTEWEHAYPKWLKEVKVDMNQMREYAKAVHKASEAYVASLTDEDLKKEVDIAMFGMPKQPASQVIGSLVIGHAQGIVGEISAIKGVQGLKGYPF